MTFAMFLPPNATEANKVPVLYWLSGLTCTPENFMQKAAAHRVAAELGIAIVAPDTSPRGENVPDDPDKAYDLGLGAGFYVNACKAPWLKHYQMYDYISQELPSMIVDHFPILPVCSIAGHSMGGHGALILALRQPDSYKSASAFSPICNPSQYPWGIRAFTHYLGEDLALWNDYDASILIGKAKEKLPIRIDVGQDDEFLSTQLGIPVLLDAATKAGYPVACHQHQGYDHSYYFISSFIADHLRFHSRYLLGI